LPPVRITNVAKRLVVGRALRSTQMSETLLPKRIALPVFASDALSSVAYAPNEVFLTLSLAGITAYAFSWKVALLVSLVMLVVVASYRQNVHAYPSGGGDYEVATTNLGPNAGLTVAAALLVDYVLTVAVSISSAAQYAASAITALHGHEATAAVVAVVVITAVNLRGVKESGTAFAIPTYVFMISILGMAVWGVVRMFFGHLPDANSSVFTSAVDTKYSGGSLATLAGVFLLLRAFSSGCAALTGVEAISNGVPAFRTPKSKNAATTLALLGGVAVTMMMSVILLARRMHVVYVDDTKVAAQLLYKGNRGQELASGAVHFAGGPTYRQDPIVGQLARGIFDHFPLAFFVVTAATGVILVLAANTAFNGFPVLASILAKHGYLPRQLQNRGDRLAFSNGIVMLALGAIILILAFRAQVTSLIQLYIVGVFVSFTLSQTGMIRHWTRLLRSETDPAARRKMTVSRVINTLGLAMTAVVLVIVLLTKFLAGAWIAIAAMIFFFFLMKAINKHYRRVADELRIGPDERLVLPSRVHAIVPVSTLHKPTMRALAFAKASRPAVLEAVHVDASTEASERLVAAWDLHGIDVPLKVIDSPFREITRPLVEYCRSIRRQSPRDVVMVYIPEYVLGRWWEQLLHNQSALRLKARLLFASGVMVTSVPYQLESWRERVPDAYGPEATKSGGPSVPDEPHAGAVRPK
jgi:amino acid transporter